MSELFNLGLPKWPGLLVVGKPVTEKQAEEILIRTNGLHFFSNDRDYTRKIYEVLGIEIDEWGLTTIPLGWEQLDKAREKYGVLELEYLKNQRIVSTWVGGPHGWCNWDGTIGCTTFNVGKWPSVEEIHAEWTLIAEAFPFLDLKSQLFDGETCENDIKPVVQFDIKEGGVAIKLPDEDLGTVDDHFLFSLGNEVGCTIDKFKHALDTTLSRVANPSFI